MFLKTLKGIRRIGLTDEAALQRLCEKCSDYFITVQGCYPGKNMARNIIEELPEGKHSKDKFVFALFDDKQNMIGVMDIVRNYPVDDEWWLGLLLLDPNIRGKGVGRSLHSSLIEQLSEQEVFKLRLGVVSNNTRARHFWRKLGYFEARRVNLQIGEKDNEVIILEYLI